MTDSEILKEIEQKIIQEIDNYWNKKISVDYLTPALTDAYRTMLVSIYSRYAEELSEIEKRLPFDWTTIRKNCESVKAADMEYNRTSDGQRRIELKIKLETLKKMISSLRDRLNRLRDESFNSY